MRCASSGHNKQTWALYFCAFDIYVKNLKYTGFTYFKIIQKLIFYGFVLRIIRREWFFLIAYVNRLINVKEIGGIPGIPGIPSIPIPNVKILLELFFNKNIHFIAIHYIKLFTAVIYKTLRITTHSITVRATLRITVMSYWLIPIFLSCCVSWLISVSYWVSTLV